MGETAAGVPPRDKAPAGPRDGAGRQGPVPSGITAALARGSDLRRHAESCRPRFLDELAQLCAIESSTGYGPGVSEAAEWIGNWGKARGWGARSWPDPAAGDGAIVTVPGGTADGLRLMMIAHHDTVNPVGAALEQPPRRVGNTLIGPGAVDAKGGVLLALYAMAALEENDVLGPFARVSLISTPDAETTMRVSAAMVDALGHGYDVALVLSPARATGDRADIISTGPARLGELAQASGRALGTEISVTASGTSALSALCAGHGLPVLDRVGPAGGMEHTVDEYVTVSSVVSRLALLAMLSHAIAEAFPLAADGYAAPVGRQRR